MFWTAQPNPVMASIGAIFDANVGPEPGPSCLLASLRTNLELVARESLPKSAAAKTTAILLEALDRSRGQARERAAEAAGWMTDAQLDVELTQTKARVAEMLERERAGVIGDLVRDYRAGRLSERAQKEHDRQLAGFLIVRAFGVMQYQAALKDEVMRRQATSLA